MFEGIIRNSWLHKGKALFKQGLTPHALALSITLGVVVGILPLFGLTTWIVTIIAISLRVNLPLAIFTVYAVSPIHILLIVPFIQLGEWMLSIDQSMLSFEQIKMAFSTDFLSALHDLSYELAYGLLAWAVVAIPLALIIYVMLNLLFSFLENRKSPRSTNQ